jgi:hypothetical protein
MTEQKDSSFLGKCTEKAAWFAKNPTFPSKYTFGFNSHKSQPKKS